MQRKRIVIDLQRASEGIAVYIFDMKWMCTSSTCFVASERSSRVADKRKVFATAQCNINKYVRARIMHFSILFERSHLGLGPFLLYPARVFAH